MRIEQSILCWHGQAETLRSFILSIRIHRIVRSTWRFFFGKPLKITVTLRTIVTVKTRTLEPANARELLASIADLDAGRGIERDLLEP